MKFESDNDSVIGFLDFEKDRQKTLDIAYLFHISSLVEVLSISQSLAQNGLLISDSLLVTASPSLVCEAGASTCFIRLRRL